MKSSVWRPSLTAEEERRVERIAGQISESVDALRSLRTALGLTQVELATLLQTTQSNVSKMEAGRGGSVEVYRKLVSSRGGTVEVVARIGGQTVVLPI